MALCRGAQPAPQPVESLGLSHLLGGLMTELEQTCHSIIPPSEDKDFHTPGIGAGVWQPQAGSQDPPAGVRATNSPRDPWENVFFLTGIFSQGEGGYSAKFIPKTRDSDDNHYAPLPSPSCLGKGQITPSLSREKDRSPLGIPGRGKDRAR